jgi:hypothetical protein
MNGLTLDTFVWVRTAYPWILAYRAHFMVYLRVICAFENVDSRFTEDAMRTTLGGFLSI